MRVTHEESRPVASGAASKKITGGRSETSVATTADTPWCHADEMGLPDLACWAAMTDQYRRGWVAGHAAAHAERDAQEAAQEAAVHALAARTAIDHLDVHLARQRAAARWSA